MAGGSAGAWSGGTSSSGTTGGAAGVHGGTSGGTSSGGAGESGSGGVAASGGAGAASAAGTSSYGGAHNPESPSDWVGIVGTGQSLAVGWDGPLVSDTQPFDNLKLEDSGPDPKYPIEESAAAVWSAIPLVEPIRSHVPGSGPGYSSNGQYPNNIWGVGDSYGESPHSGMANTLSALWDERGEPYVTAHTEVGEGGVGIAALSKGTRSYAAALNETRVFTELATAAGKSYGVSGIIFTHGETDAGNPNYGQAIYQLWQDYNADLKQVTGQSTDVVMLGSQQSSFSSGYGESYGSAVQLWKAGADHPGQIVCTGPKYQYGGYGLHMPASGYERLGEKYAEVFDLIVNQGVDWKPLGPKSVSRDGSVITLELDVPNPPLAWDENLAKPHQVAHTAWSEGRGFEVLDAEDNELAIASVAIEGNSVIITLESDPGSGSLTLGYGLTQDTGDGYQGGTALGPHGQLRDSDDFAGYDVETVELDVTNGSASISGLSARRAALDRVNGEGLPEGTVLLGMAWGNGTLSAPWSGATGKAELTFRHNHYNYCVHFAIEVP
jgi:hypothetical protein